MHPDQIDWSNIPDYFDREPFLNIARAVSDPGTVHTAHFMNWVNRTFGTCFFDIPEDERQMMYSSAVEGGLKSMIEVHLRDTKGINKEDICEYPINELS